MTKEELANELETLADRAQSEGFVHEARVLRLFMGASLIGLSGGLIEFLQPFSKSVHNVWKILVEDQTTEKDEVLAAEFLIEKQDTKRGMDTDA